MMKVEAVVVRDRVETVIDAVEEETGHVGVTVLEAVGHGRERGITHEYRGRVFESRFLPKALPRSSSSTTQIAERRSSTRSPTPPAPATSIGRRDLLDVTRRERRSTTAPGERWRRWRSRMSNKDLLYRREHDLGRHRGRPRHVHAGRLRVPRGRADADEERRPHRGEERAHLRRRLDRLLPRRVRDRVRRRRRRPRRRLRASCRRSTSCSRSAQAPFSWFGAIPGAAGYLFEVVFAGVSLAIVWGAMAERTKLWVYFVFGVVFTLIYSVVSHWIWSPDGWLFSKGMQDFAGSTVVHYQGALAGLAGALLLGPRIGKYGRREAERDPGPQHGLHDARRDHPLVRLVRVQPGLDAERRLRRASASSPTSR